MMDIKLSKTKFLETLSHQKNLDLQEASTSRSHSMFADGGRQKAGRSTTHGRKRLQRQYETKTPAGFTQEEMDEVRQIFDFYDVDNFNVMQFKDLDRALCALGYNPTEEEVDHLSEMMNVDDDTTMDFAEFCLVIEHMRSKKGRCGELRDAFRCIDLNGDGKVSSENLLKLLMNRHDALEYKQAHELIKFVDRQDTGEIEYEKFISKLKFEEKRMDFEQRVKSDAISNKSSVDSPFLKRKFTSSNRQLRRKILKKRTSSKRPRQRGSVKVYQRSEEKEMVDTVAKAMAGPVLIVSAIIIKAETGKAINTPKSRWAYAAELLKCKKI